jgi:superfamily II DNA or RNA helicase
MPEFHVDMRGLTLRASRHGASFLPVFEAADGLRIAPASTFVLEGPPTWIATKSTAYLIDGSFDAKKAIETSRGANGTIGDPAAPLAPRTIARVAPFLSPTDRGELGIADAEKPSGEIALAWISGALVATLTFIDRASTARAPYAALGAIASLGTSYVRFSPEHAAALRSRLIDCGFVPRSADGFALHGPDRAVAFVKETLPEWTDLDRRLDTNLRDLVEGNSDLDINVSAYRAHDDPDWFELKIDVMVGAGDALTAKELAALLATSGRFAEVRGKLIDVSKLRERNALLTDLADRRRSGFAALLALRDELHENFSSVALPPEVEALREKLRDFSGIPQVVPPELHNGSLRSYQQRGLDFLAYLNEFGFGGILADEMGLGKAQDLDAKVLGPTGWLRMGDIVVGDRVMNAQGGVSRVIGVYPQGELEAFRVTFSDGASTICSDDHLWAVNTALRNSRKNSHRVLTLAEIRSRLRDGAGNARHFIPLAAPFRYDAETTLSIDPYLLGCLLGDGHFKYGRIAISTSDEYVRESVRALLPTGTELVSLGRYDYGIRVEGTRGSRFRPNPLRAALRSSGLLGHGGETKFVPREYLFASVPDRIAVLQGLLDTDGGIGSDGHIEYTSTSERLARDVADLVRSLGGTARLRVKPAPTYRHLGELRTGRPAYRVTVALPAGVAPFRLPRKLERYTGRSKYPPSRAIVSVEPIGRRPMQCIAVDAPDRLYVTDDYIVTHNTIQVISHLLKRKNEEGTSPSLVIAPTSVTHTWENEIRRFAPELKTLRLHSGAERAARYEEVPNADVVITSYALARLDAEQLARHYFRTLILDEAQNAKNPSSQIARVVRALRAEQRLALTGTPVENSLRDLWAIFAFVEPGLLGTESSFRKRFEIPISENDERAITTLRSRLEPFVLRRTKEDVAPELPERTEVVLECDLSPLQRRLYRGVAEAARREVFAVVEEQGIESATVHVLAALTRLRQICAHPGLLFEEYRDEAEASAKFDAFLETVDEILSGGHRLLVFSAFASMLRIMRAALDRRGISYGYLDGATKDKDRQEEVARFMQPDGPPLFLCSLKAGGVGLTLTAADYVILYDPWWNPAVERQAIDRTHRIGQHRAVTAYRFVTSGTVEEKIRALAERKSSLSKNIIKADGALAKALTRADLEMLFADPE